MTDRSEQKNTVLLTGNTGNFGRYLAFDLLKREVHLILLVRAASTEEARTRVQHIIDVGKEKVSVYAGDLAEEHLGLLESQYRVIAERVTHILHAAATARFTLPLEAARMANVHTTEQMLRFAKHCPHLRRFGFVSTAMVAGKRSGHILEDEFEHAEGFKNTYEQTKYEAEALVRGHKETLPVAIFRPSLLIPHISVKHPKRAPIFLKLAIYFVAHGYLPFVPGSGESTIDVVDSRDAAHIIDELLLKEGLHHLTYHITNGIHTPRVKTLHALMEKEFRRPIPLEYCGSLEAFEARVRNIPWYRPGRREAYRRSRTFLPEAAFPKIFDNRNTLTELNISRIERDPIESFRTIMHEGLWDSSV